MFAGDAGRTDTRGGDTLRTLVNPKTGSSAVPTGQLPFYFIFSFFIPPFISLRLHFLRHFALFPRASLSLSLSLSRAPFAETARPVLSVSIIIRGGVASRQGGWVSRDGGKRFVVYSYPVRFPSLRSTQEGLLERRENIVPPVYSRPEDDNRPFLGAKPESLGCGG